MVAPASKRPVARARTAWDTVFEALPDVLAAGACALALVRPDALGFDLLRTAGLLFFLELPIALVGMFTGALRVDERAMDRRTKLGFIITPTLVIGLFALLALGPHGLFGVLWLSGASLYRWLTGAPPSPPVPGFWMRYGTGDGGEGSSVSSSVVTMSFGGKRGTTGKAREWKVLGGVEQFDAVFTATFWVLTALLVLFVDLPQVGVTAEYAATVGWSDTLIGQAVPPSTALWCGAILFVLRAFLKLDRFGSAELPPSSVEDDVVLREIIESVEGKRGKGKSKRRR